MEGECIVKVPGRFFWRRQGFRFTMGTWMLMSDYTQLALNEFDRLDEKRNFLTVAAFCAAWCYSAPRGKPKFTEKDIEEWIKKMPTASAQKILDTMVESRIGGESMASLIEKSEDVKKKSGPLKSETMPSGTSG